MIRLALLLHGTEATRRRWWQIMALGLAWLALGLVIGGDGLDGVALLATGAFGALMLAEGLLRLGAAIGEDRWRRGVDLLDGVALVVLALLILDWPIRTEANNGLLFGLGLLLDGALRGATAAVVRYPRWKGCVLLGAAQALLALGLCLDWPMHHGKGVPVVLGVALVVSGFSAIRVALYLRRLPVGATVAALPFYRRPGRGAFPAAVPEASAAPVDHPAEAGEAPFTTYVWTATGSSADPRRLPLLDRYVAAVGKDGRISTGHAACGVGDILYISHYRAEELDVSTGGLAAMLDSGARNDVPGRFLPSYAGEAADWTEATARVEFRHYNLARLKAFWAAYGADGTYNLTDRNCSVAVAMALDVALEGVLGEERYWLSLLGLLRNPDLWAAAMLRRRAETMVWTPGLVLDYARALARIVEAPEGRGARGLRRWLRIMARRRLHLRSRAGAARAG